MTMDEKNVYVIDTDIGDDIDDAFAVALAVKGGMNLAMVSTVFRNTTLRAKQAMQLLETLGSKTPVFCGEKLPLGGVVPLFGYENGNGANAENAVPCQYDDSMDGYLPKANAPQEIVRLAKKHSGNLVLLPIGGMTNVAKALQLDPTIAKDVKAVVAMHGWYSQFLPEWNVVCDPEAANVVYSSGIPFYGVGLDVTLQCALDDDLLKDFRASDDPSNRLIVRWLDRWFDRFRFEKSVMHDPLAVCCAIRDDVCVFEKRYVRAVTEGEKRGAVETLCQPKEGFFPVNVATSVDKRKFYDFVRNALLNN